MLITYQDADGNNVTVDDEVTALGPTPRRSPESHFDRQFIPIRSFHLPPHRDEDWRTKRAPLPSGYGISQEELDRYLAGR